MAANWAPDSWTNAEARQLPRYPDQNALDAATKTLATYPPLVFACEARSLTAELAEVAAVSCFRAAIVPRALPSIAPTISAIPSASSFRWRSS